MFRLMLTFCIFLFSNVRWRSDIHNHRRVSGKSSPPLRQDVLDARSTALPELRANHSFANWPFLVRMDPGAARSLDRAYDGDRVCDNGPVFHLLGRLELLNGHVSSLRQLCFGCTVVLYVVALLHLQKQQNPGPVDFFFKQQKCQYVKLHRPQYPRRNLPAHSRRHVQPNDLFRRLESFGGIG